MSVPFKLLPLAENPEYCGNCIELLNEEWPRNPVYRQISMKKSLNKLPPMSLVLLDSNNDLVGHARLCPLPIIENGCWIESVVIWKRLRGHGIGRFLMNNLEEESKKYGFTKIYLTTTDKIDFYLKCGYTKCAPVVNFGSNTRLFERSGLDKFLKGIVDQQSKIQVTTNDNKINSYIEKTTMDENVSTRNLVPQPLLLSTHKERNNFISKKTYMLKNIC